MEKEQLRVPFLKEISREIKKATSYQRRHLGIQLFISGEDNFIKGRKVEKENGKIVMFSNTWMVLNETGKSCVQLVPLFLAELLKNFELKRITLYHEQNTLLLEMERQKYRSSGLAGGFVDVQVMGKKEELEELYQIYIPEQKILEMQKKR